MTGDVIRKRKETELPVDSSTCNEAVKTRVTPAGTLNEHASGNSITPINIIYKCRDWSTHTTSTKVFEVHSFEASISEGEPIIAQD